jgi:hypothetical protein
VEVGISLSLVRVGANKNPAGCGLAKQFLLSAEQNGLHISKWFPLPSFLLETRENFSLYSL